MHWTGASGVLASVPLPPEPVLPASPPVPDDPLPPADPPAADVPPVPEVVLLPDEVAFVPPFPALEPVVELAAVPPAPDVVVELPLPACPPTPVACMTSLPSEPPHDT
jgi:hypothetical protein